MQPNWPEGVEEIVKAVGEKLKKGDSMGPSHDNDENAAWVVIDRIQTEWMHSDPQRTLDTWEWARKQYVKMLLIATGVA
jgi:hypothetical protein